MAGYDAAFDLAVKERVDAVLVSPYSALPTEAAARAIRHRLPTMTLMGSVGHVGQLLAYGANFREQVRRVAGYVDRILKGTQPGNLPVELPTKFELVINLKTAKALGLTIPPALLARADQVIASDRAPAHAPCPAGWASAGQWLDRGDGSSCRARHSPTLGS